MGSGSKIPVFDIAGLSPGIGGGKSNFELKLQVAENDLVIARGRGGDCPSATALLLVRRAKDR